MSQDFLLLNLGILKKTYISSKKLLEYWKKVESELKIVPTELTYNTTEWQTVLQFFKQNLFQNEFVEYVSSYMLWKEEIVKVANFLEKAGVVILNWWERTFPVQLKYCSDPPLFLFTFGNLEYLSTFNKSFAFVGTRNPSLYGRKLARALMWQSKLAQVCTVSGFATGVDTIVFQESRKYQNPTVAVLPYLPDTFPFHRKDSKTLFISEYFAPQAVNAKWMYVERNRIIAALTIATIIIEAPPRSGALITADFAYSYNRFVYYLAQSVESVSGAGGLLHSIINNEGRVIRSLYDVLNDLDEEHSKMFTAQFENYFMKQINKYIKVNKFLKKQNDLRLVLKSRDIKHNLWRWCGKNLKLFQNVVIELKRLDMIHEYKGLILINFLYSPSSWQKI